MSAEVTLTIDGVPVTVPAGTLVIRAAEMIGRYIPRFCDHPLLDPAGACRQCLVEIEGQRKPLTACTTTVSEGMVVLTQATSAIAKDAQDGVLEMLLINHPLDCPMCDKGGECPLQDQTLAYGPGGSRYIDAKRRYVKPVPISPLVKLDRERCVLCTRCTRFSDQIAGDPFIELFERGATQQIGVFQQEPYDSIFSGNVIQICPVGALTSSAFRFKARPFDMTTTEGTCNRCASGCSIAVQERRGELVRVLAAENGEANDEWICDKGRFGYVYAASPERVTEPLVRKGDEFVAVSWSEAIEEVAAQMAFARAGGRPAAVLGGQQLAAEDAYALSRFARTVLETNDIDARMRPSAGDEEEDVLTEVARSRTATAADVDAAKTIVVVGTDLHEESPIVFLRVRKTVRKRGARVIEVGPRRTLARAGAQWIPCVPGGEADAIAALQVESDGLVVLAGERLATSPGGLTAAWNLAANTGGRFGWIPRKAGARGALDAGLYPTLLPGGRRADDADARAQVGQVWGTDVPATPGRDAFAILDRAHDLGVLFLVGADPVRDFAHDDLGARGLDAAPFVVALDLFLTESAARANVVLPVAASYERDGTFVSWDGRGGVNRGAVPHAGITQADFEILAQIAHVAGHQFPSTLEALRAERAALAVQPSEPAPVAPWTSTARARGTDLVLASSPVLLDDGTMMTGAEELRATAPAFVAEMNPADAARLAIADGDEITIAIGPASSTVPVRLREDIAAGVVFVPARTGRDLAASGQTVSVTKAEA